MNKNEMGYRALRDAGSKAIEEAFTKALCELAGEEYEVEVSGIDFNSTDGAWERDRTKITVIAHRKRDSLFHPDAFKEEDSASRTA